MRSESAYIRQVTLSTSRQKL